MFQTSEQENFEQTGPANLFHQNNQYFMARHGFIPQQNPFNSQFSSNSVDYHNRKRRLEEESDFIRKRANKKTQLPEGFSTQIETAGAGSVALMGTPPRPKQTKPVMASDALVGHGVMAAEMGLSPSPSAKPSPRSRPSTHTHSQFGSTTLLSPSVPPAIANGTGNNVFLHNHHANPTGLPPTLSACRSCSTCQSGVWGQCRYCDLPLCSGCTRQCDSCAHAFCSVCLSATYSTRYDHEVHLCPGCLQNDGISISHPHPQMADAPQSAGQQEDVSMMML